MSRHVLLANVTLAGRTGTEIVTRDLAFGLARRGHRVSVYSPVLGAIADELRAAGLAVSTRLADFDQPDVVHGHHHVETVEALHHFTGAVGVFVCHDRTAAHSIPPLLDRIRRYVAVDRHCLERLTGDWDIPAERTRLILNAVDLARFDPRSPLPSSPHRALVFSHYAAPGSHDHVVRAACAELGLAVDIIGARAGTVVDAPEHVLCRYDLVFAKARCAIEAMAVGCAVVLCDAAGMGPMVTLANYAELREWNFGARTLTDPLDARKLAAEARGYDPAQAAEVSRAIRRDASLDAALDQYVAIYEEAIADPAAPSSQTTAVRAFIAPLIQRISSLESDVAVLQRPDRMDPLSEDDIAQLQVTLEYAPVSLMPGETAIARVLLRNGLPDRALGSWRPYPLQWGVRWRAADAPGFPRDEPERTPIRHGVAPGVEAHFAVNIRAPAAPGRYVLRITLVQEGLRWLDETATRACRDVELDVPSS